MLNDFTSKRSYKSLAEVNISQPVVQHIICRQQIFLEYSTKVLRFLANCWKESEGRPLSPLTNSF